jgi:hypothetical protein
MNPLTIIARFIGDNKIIAVGAAVILLLMGGAAWLALHVRAEIKAHDAAVNLEALKADKQATETADKRAADLAVITAREAAQRQKDIDNAVQKYPVETRRSVGPATNAVADRLRTRANRDD